MNINIDIDKLVLDFLKEDIPNGDITTESIFAKDVKSTAILITKENGIIAGCKVLEKVFSFLDKDTSFAWHKREGSAVTKSEIIVQISGSIRKLLMAERTALNIFQRMCGIATKTREFCYKIEGYKTKIVDTRKTAPGLRYLDKYAVRVGGGYNHRFCLSDGVLIKDNHIKAAGSISSAIELARKNVPHTLKIEVETENLESSK